MSNDNTQHDTPDLMRELLENAGYKLEGFSLLIGHRWFYKVQSSDGWIYSLSTESNKDADKVLVRHQVIQQAYAHLQQQQETERLRTRVAELEAELQSAQYLLTEITMNTIKGASDD